MEEFKDFFCFGQGMHNEASQNHRANRMQTVFEGGDDAKIPTSAAYRPKKVLVFGVAGGQEPAIRGDDVHRKQVIGRSDRISSQPAHTPTQSQTGNAGMRNGTTSCC